MQTKLAGKGATDVRLLRRLCDAVGVAGDEGEVRDIVLAELKAAGANHTIDAMGNLLLTRPGRGARRLRVMLDAHIDEVGFILVSDDGEGIYQFRPVGHIEAMSLVGKHVVVGRKHMPGVIGTKPIHLIKREDLKRALDFDTLRVDLGLGGKAKVGDRGTFAPNFRRVGPSIMSKALDNRLGVGVLTELVKTAPHHFDLLAAFTVQEEIGFRGAQVAAQRFKPDVAIVIDATPANDLPMQREGENTFYNAKLGLGPAIYVADRSAIDDSRMVRFLTETAERMKIPYQLRQPGGGGTNAGAIQQAIRGVPVATVSVPHRYSHTAMSVARIEDWQNTLLLLSAALRRLTPEVVRRGVQP